MPPNPWSKPPPRWIKLSINAHFNPDDRIGGVGLVLRYDDGDPLFTSCQFLHDCESALESELCACVEGLNLALHHSPLTIIAETDCSQLVAATIFVPIKIA
jgi:ribonuclease HI